MTHATASQGFAADLQVVNQDGIVVLHRWADGMLLVMTFDDEMPAFTAKGIKPGALEGVRGKDAVTSATGYVFQVVEPDVNGAIDFEGLRYALLDIEDYVVWTDEEAVRRKYNEVREKARGAQ